MKSLCNFSADHYAVNLLGELGSYYHFFLFRVACVTDWKAMLAQINSTDNEPASIDKSVKIFKFRQAFYSHLSEFCDKPIVQN